jgi:hypothetical protein
MTNIILSAIPWLSPALSHAGPATSERWSPTYPREWAGRAAPGEGREAGLLGEAKLGWRRFQR